MSNSRNTFAWHLWKPGQIASDVAAVSESVTLIPLNATVYP
jgi:hypothetical protein